MNTLAIAASVSIGIAGVLTFYSALLHIMRPGAAISFRFRILRDLAVVVQSLQMAAIALSLQFGCPVLLYPALTLLFLNGPLYYIRYFMLFYPGERIPRRVLVQLLPAVLVLAYETWFYFLSGDDPAAVLRVVFSNPMGQPVTAVLFIGVLTLLFHYFLLMRLDIGYIKRTRAGGPVNVSLVLTLFYVLGTLLVTCGFLAVSSDLLDTGIFLLGLTGITYLLFENRYPHFYRLVVQEEKQQRYRKSVLQGLSKEKIIGRLKELMEEEKIYHEYELKLGDVASMLLITPHQLSEFINDCMGVNFSSYVNRYRVSEARELLVTRPGQSILSIGLEVGFGSKPSFNVVFKQETGMTPTEFRKRNLSM